MAALMARPATWHASRLRWLKGCLVCAARAGTHSVGARARAAPGVLVAV